jgi:hypothetical protein
MKADRVIALLLQGFAEATERLHRMTPETSTEP